MNKQPATPWRTWTARLVAIICLVFALAVASNASGGPYTAPNPNPGQEQPGVTLDPTKKNTLTPAQLAQLLGLTPDQAKNLLAGCIGLPAALQRQTPVEDPLHPGVYGPTTFPEAYKGNGATTTPCDSKVKADEEAAKAPAGSTVVIFQKQGGNADADGNPGYGSNGSFDYNTVVKSGGNTYYVDANHYNDPGGKGATEFYATTTAPKECTAGDTPYDASKWYVTVIPAKK